MRLERNDLRWLIEHGIGVEALVGFSRPNADVDAITKPLVRISIFRLVAFREEFEAVDKLGFGVPSIGVDMSRCENNARTFLQHLAGLVRENVRIPADLV